jgi:Fe-S oxidoreductase
MFSATRSKKNTRRKPLRVSVTESGLSKFQAYLPIYEGDRFCLMCGQACPVRRVTRNEATSPHGWALLISSVQRGMLQWNAETVDVLFRCSDCGNCQGNCATDRPLPYAIQAARAEVIHLGYAPASVLALDEKLRAWGNPYAKAEDGDASSRIMPKLRGVHDDASGRLKDEESNPAIHRPPSVALFVGDAAHFLRPQVVEAAEKLLRAVGDEPIRFRQGHSSGYLPYSVGLWETARRLAQETALGLRELDAARVVVLSTYDAHALKHVYAELDVALPENVNITTLVDYLANASAGDKLKIKPRSGAPYTYHDPAQAVRLKGHGLNARVLATEVMGSEPREMLYRETLATPVGNSGGLAFTQPALAETLARTRIQEAKATGAKIVLTDDPLDTATLEKYADGIQVLNLFEVLAEQVQ